jgi:hypothetical protein
MGEDGVYTRTYGPHVTLDYPKWARILSLYLLSVNLIDSIMYSLS